MRVSSDDVMTSIIVDPNVDSDHEIGIYVIDGEKWTVQVRSHEHSFPLAPKGAETRRIVELEVLDPTGHVMESFLL